MRYATITRKIWVGLVLAFALLNLVPLIWMVVLAVVGVDAETETLRLDQAAFERLLTTLPVWRWTFNTFLVSTAATLGNLVFCSMAGYAFAMKRAPGMNLLFWFCLLTMMVPSQVTVIPLFLMASKVGLMNSYTALIVPSLATAFGIFMMRQFISTLPRSVLEAARIDGCSEWMLFVRIVLPMVRPALGALGILTFTSSWNNFLWPLVVCNRRDMWTLPVGIASLQTEFNVDMPLLMAGATFAAVPMIVLFFIMQRHFVSGLTLGYLKR